MAVSAVAVAKYLCRASGWTISNLEVQKMMYLSHMAYLGASGRRLVSESFEAWDYGPVVPSVYRRLKVFGSRPVRNLFHDVQDIQDPNICGFLDSAYNALSQYSAAQLIDITHKADSAWAKVYEPGRIGNSPIMDDIDIQQDYQRMTSAA